MDGSLKCKRSFPSSIQCYNAFKITGSDIAPKKKRKYSMINVKKQRSRSKMNGPLFAQPYLYRNADN